jgi:hypothetical protein
MSANPTFVPFGEWRKHQRRKPLTPEAVLPDTARTEKRLIRSASKELARPKPSAATSPKPQPTMADPEESLKDKLVRFGWQTENGASLDWRYWNRQRPMYSSRD